MSTLTARLPRWSGRIGFLGLVLTILGGILWSFPAALAIVARVASLVLGIWFRAAAILVLCLGLWVIVYSIYSQRHGGMTDAVERRIAIAVGSIFALSLVYPLVVLDDLARVLGGTLAQYGPDLAAITYFYAGLVVFGALTLIGVADALRRRV